MAVNCSAVAGAIDRVVAVTEIETSVAVTVRLADPSTPFRAAEMVTLPCCLAVTMPFESTVAMPVSDEVHCTLEVRFCADPSL